MRELAKRAKLLRIHAAYLDSLRSMVEQLENRPLEWGDPEYRTKLPGGIVCHGITWPLIVRFAVYEARNSVIIFNIAPLPNTPLANA
jgi:hypothetical protein